MYKKGQKGKKEVSEQKRKDREKKTDSENDKSREEEEEEEERMDEEPEAENEAEEEDVENWWWHKQQYTPITLLGVLRSSDTQSALSKTESIPPGSVSQQWVEVQF